MLRLRKLMGEIGNAHKLREGAKFSQLKGQNVFKSGKCRTRATNINNENKWEIDDICYFQNAYGNYNWGFVCLDPSRIILHLLCPYSDMMFASCLHGLP